MLGFVGYSFNEDGGSLDPYPTSVENIDSIVASNAIYDELYLTYDTTSAYSTTIPTEWDIYTIFLAAFENSLAAGNIGAEVDNITSVRIKRRRVGDYDWITLAEYPVSTPADLEVVGEDYFNAYGQEYEYAWVPVLNDTEGQYITATIESKFKGVFVADATTIYKFYAGVTYGESRQVQQVGVFAPLGRQYPVYIANGQTNYQTGSLSGYVMGDYETTKTLDRTVMVGYKNALLEFLTNKGGKVLKDDNGNIWLIFVTGEPSVSYNSSWGNGLMSVGFEYGELGDANNETDLVNAGLIET